MEKMLTIYWEEQSILIEAKLVWEHGLKSGDKVDFPTIDKLLKASLQISVNALREALELNRPVGV